jgi:tRNA U34 5-carboxymethylaminomethyl modifying GTPase MnmE/TrmE
MATYQQYKQQVLQLFDRAVSLAVHYRYPDTQKHLEEAKKHLEQGKLFVVVCGEFRQGKSSLLNALLNE